MKRAKTDKPMIVAGIMSGTSADGVDVVLCRISPIADDESPRIRLLGLKSYTYSKPVRAEILALMAGETRSAAEFGRLNWRLGEVYAECVAAAAEELGVKPALVGCHGQTIHHETAPTRFLGSTVRSTWQIGEAAPIAERMRCPVVSDFRPADLAAGGEGAPLVPMLDWCLFRSRTVSRVLQNIGGIGNLSVIPAGAAADRLLAFDTGPGNMIIDQTMQTLLGRRFDRNGAVARRGRVLDKVIVKLLRDRYFSALPPKSCGREQFGAAFTQRLIRICRQDGGSDTDCVATATAFTAESIRMPTAGSLLRASPRTRPKHQSVLHRGWRPQNNGTLMQMLSSGLGVLRVKVQTSEELGIPSQAKEAVAFALLAWLTWNGVPGNVPSATGADRPIVVGKVTNPGGASLT